MRINHPRRSDYIEYREWIGGYRGVLHVNNDQFDVEATWAFTPGLSWFIVDHNNQRKVASKGGLPEYWLIISGHWQY